VREFDTKMDENSQFTAQELQLIEFVIRTPTISKTKLSELMDVSRTKIIDIYNRPHVKAEIQKYQQSNIERFVELQSEALETLSELMENSDPSIRLQASKTFADALKTLKIEHAGEVGVKNVNIIIEAVKPEPFKELESTDELTEISDS